MHVNGGIRHLEPPLNCVTVTVCFAENEVSVWDEGPDSEKNIRMDPKRGVVAATFNKLVERLTSEGDHGAYMFETLY